jgi:hypothetical protein
MAARGFQVVGVGENEEQTPQQKDHTAANERDARILMLAISTISKRSIIAISNLFSLLSVASVWLLTYRVLPEPSQVQLVGICGYAIFILLLEIIRRRNPNVS